MYVSLASFPSLSPFPSLHSLLSLPSLLSLRSLRSPPRRPPPTEPRRPVLCFCTDFLVGMFRRYHASCFCFLYVCCFFTFVVFSFRFLILGSQALARIAACNLAVGSVIIMYICVQLLQRSAAFPRSPHRCCAYESVSSKHKCYITGSPQPRTRNMPMHACSSFFLFNQGVECFIVAHTWLPQ